MWKNGKPALNPTPVYIIQTNPHLSVYKDTLEDAHARLCVVARIWSQPKYPLMREIDKENV